MIRVIVTDQEKSDGWLGNGRSIGHAEREMNGIGRVIHSADRRRFLPHRRRAARWVTRFRRAGGHEATLGRLRCDSPVSASLCAACNTIQSLIGTARLNGLDPAAWLRDTLEKLPAWPNSRIDELLPLRGVSTP